MILRNFVINSDYDTPWIVWKTEVNFTVPTYGFLRPFIAHGLPFTPLLLGEWSNNENFNPSFDILVTVPEGISGGQPPRAQELGADSNNVYFDLTNNYDQDLIFYYRLAAFAEIGYQGQVNPSDDDTAFRYNSDYDYQKLLFSGASNGPFQHNLGYIPQARTWIERTIGAGEQAHRAISPAASVVDGSSLEVPNNSFIYHIYGDGF